MTSREQGQAVIETLLVSLILLIPLLWALGVLSDLHRAALSATAAAREAAIDAASSSDLASAGVAVDQAVHEAFADEGLDPTRAHVSWNATLGFARGGTVVVRVDYPVTVVQFPFLGRVAGPSIAVKATDLARIDPYRSRS